MKTSTILLFTLGLFFMHAKTLKCRQSSCVGTTTCKSITVTCGDGLDHCFIMTQSSTIFTMARGCIKELNCLKLKAFEPPSVCCKKDLCN